MKLTFVLFVLAVHLLGQNVKADTLEQKNDVRLNYKSLLIPTILIAYGVVGIESDRLKDINCHVKNQLWNGIDKKFTIDDFSQNVPFLSVYGLNCIGIKGKNNFKDRTVILGTAALIMGSTVYGVKNLSAIRRPDGSSSNSFPSGHTATAFMGAEFLYREYKDVSAWYGISGYLVAAGTGFLRIYNDRHWLSDVATGAGIGILSTKIAYRIHPFIKRVFFKDKKNMSGLVMPFYTGKEYGLSLSMTFF